jgi:RNA-directed DNA polymerase
VACFLTLHPQKTKIAYRKDDRRRGIYPVVKLDFLGYSFQPRMAKCYGGKMFVGFNPAISTKAATGIRQEMRRWRLHLRSDLALGDLAKLANPALRGRIKLLRALLPAHRGGSMASSSVRPTSSPTGNPWARGWMMGAV